MEEKEKIKVFVDIQNGKTVCICRRSNKKCGKKCEPDVVERDRFADWESAFHRDKYGRRNRYQKGGMHMNSSEQKSRDAPALSTGPPGRREIQKKGRNAE